MKIVFFGSGKIAIPSLDSLIKNNDVACVVTAPDKKKGRHLPISFTPIKEFALKKELNIFQPEDILAKQSIEYLKKLNADVFIVFSFGKILSRDLLDIPKLFALNIHASLLPKYRGAAPINQALINGEEKTGITIIKMNEKMDEGNILLRKGIGIDYSDNVLTLEEKISKLAAKSLQEALYKINQNEIRLIKQEDKEASYAPKLKKEDGRINWNKQAHQIRNQIRGCLPWPGAFTFYKSTMLKIWDAEVINEIQKKDKCLSGTIISLDKKGILVATKEGFLLIKELQSSSGRRLSAWQFIQGHKFVIGSKLD
ncbi:MAG: methionyl-tRNA formyltransferase [Candidatus Omnitrophica bacterium]|nr:methionyl-tRNA formyltransferase [Candidatus Omnitrophota bacterium]MDD5352434.1 methionyl-tRNA formyltransferase [Candidatus Omnitrophota bacterium]MDD5550032.1 methionyl-tRNA formyltransferase [Candidatus Omnitrophota bacterium]